MADCWRADTCYFPTAAVALHIPACLTTRIRSAYIRCGFRVFSAVIKPRGSYATPLSFARNGIYFRHLGNTCVVCPGLLSTGEKVCSRRDCSPGSSINVAKTRRDVCPRHAINVHTHARRVDAFCRPTVIPLRGSGKSLRGFLYPALWKRRKLKVAINNNDNEFRGVRARRCDRWRWVDVAYILSKKINDRYAVESYFSAYGIPRWWLWW